MNDPHLDDVADRIIKLAETMHKAATALEQENWLECQRLLAECARIARVLVMMEKEK